MTAESSSHASFPTSPPAPLRDGLARLWALEEGVTFLNHGSFGAVPRAVLDEQAEWRRRIEARPVEMLGRRCEELIDAAKQLVGEWLGMRPADFGLVTNATEGVNTVLRSLDFGAGDELLTTTHVYGAVRQAMKYVAGRTGASYRELDVPLPVSGPGHVAEAVLAGLSTRTRLLVLDHATSPTGLVFPVESIARGCAERGVDVLVDGAHAPAMLPLDIDRLGDAGVAYYAGNLHKWACAPKGAGFLWVRPDRQADIHPLVVSHLLGQGFAREFSWQGTRDVTAWLTVPRALAFMNDLGWESVRQHNHAMAAWAHGPLCRRWGVEPVSPADGSMVGSMATVRLPGPLAAMNEAQGLLLQQRLHDEYRVEVPLVPWGGRWLTRVSCQVYNAARDYERVADVIEQVARRGL